MGKTKQFPRLLSKGEKGRLGVSKRKLPSLIKKAR